MSISLSTKGRLTAAHNETRPAAPPKPGLRVMLEGALREQQSPALAAPMIASWFTSFTVDDFSFLIMDAVMRDRGDILRIVGRVKGCADYIDQYYTGDGDKFTPLQIAVMYGRNEAYEALIELGADARKLTGVKNLDLDQLRLGRD